eukprot:scaffold546_cov352-Prasinococcus_capsulatus_cf.AAC.21
MHASIHPSIHPSIRPSIPPSLRPSILRAGPAGRSERGDARRLLLRARARGRTGLGSAGGGAA